METAHARAGAPVRPRASVGALKTLAYLLSLALALPCVLFAIGILALDHVIETRNFLKIVYHLLVGWLWGLPTCLLVLLALSIAGLFPVSRTVAAILVVLLDVAAVVITLRGLGAPKELGEVWFYVPSVASAALAAFVVTAATPPRP